MHFFHFSISCGKEIAAAIRGTVSPQVLQAKVMTFVNQIAEASFDVWAWHDHADMVSFPSLDDFVGTPFMDQLLDCRLSTAWWMNFMGRPTRITVQALFLCKRNEPVRLLRRA